MAWPGVEHATLASQVDTPTKWAMQQGFTDLFIQLLLPEDGLTHIKSMKGYNETPKLDFLVPLSKNVITNPNSSTNGV